MRKKSLYSDTSDSLLSTRATRGSTKENSLESSPFQSLFQSAPLNIKKKSVFSDSEEEEDSNNDSLFFHNNKDAAFDKLFSKKQSPKKIHQPSSPQITRNLSDNNNDSSRDTSQNLLFQSFQEEKDDAKKTRAKSRVNKKKNHLEVVPRKTKMSKEKVFSDETLEYVKEQMEDLNIRLSGNKENETIHNNSTKSDVFKTPLKNVSNVITPKFYSNCSS